MGPRRRLITGLAFGAVAVAGWLAVPRRFVVEGISMGPGLLPGDVVRTGPFPALDRLRAPRRFDRWVLAVADGLALKRVVGLPGEEITIADGDLAINGTVALKSPRLLAEMGSVVADATSGDVPESLDGWAWSRPAGEVLDDASFDEGATREVEAVRDAGLTAVVDVRDASATNPATVRVRVGDTVITRPLTEPGRHAIVAGRLDGRLVSSEWPVPAARDPAGERSCFPPAAPESWSVTEPWPSSGGDADGVAPALAIGPGEEGLATVVAVRRWRDVAYRPAADGRASWRLGADEILVLGDHPPASTDSRRWGPVQARAVRQLIPGRMH